MNQELRCDECGGPCNSRAMLSRKEGRNKVYLCIPCFKASSKDAMLVFVMGWKCDTLRNQVGVEPLELFKSND